MERATPFFLNIEKRTKTGIGNILLFIVPLKFLMYFCTYVKFLLRESASSMFWFRMYRCTVSSSYVIEHEVADTLSGKFETFGFVAALLLELITLYIGREDKTELDFLNLASKREGLIIFLKTV